MRKILIFAYVGIFFLMTLPLLLLYWLLGLFSVALRNRLTFATAQFFFRSVLTCLGAEVDVRGLEHIPAAGTILFAGNHKGTLDVALLLAYLPKPAGFIAKDNLAGIPILSWWMLGFGCLFLDRNNARRALTTILRGIENMKKGQSYVIFPEGTRQIHSNELLPFKRGSLKLAERSESLIVPFALRGTDEMFEANHYNPRPGKLYLRFGQPIDMKNLSAEEVKQIHEYVEGKVRDLFAETFADTEKCQ